MRGALRSTEWVHKNHSHLWFYAKNLISFQALLNEWMNDRHVRLQGVPKVIMTYSNTYICVSRRDFWDTLYIYQQQYKNQSDEHYVDD